MKIIVKNDILTKKRIINGLTVNGLAQKANLSFTAINRAENGLSISPKTAKEICVALNLDFEDVFEIQK